MIWCITMFSLDERYLETQTIPLTMMSNTLRKLGQYQGRQELLQLRRPQLIKTLKEIAIIQSSESSNRIEGINVDPKRLDKILNNKLKPENRSEAQVLGYRNVLSRIHNRYQEFKISPEMILQIHKDMLKYTDIDGGAWKRTDSVIEE